MFKKYESPKRVGTVTNVLLDLDAVSFLNCEDLLFIENEKDKRPMTAQKVGMRVRSRRGDMEAIR